MSKPLFDSKLDKFPLKDYVFTACYRGSRVFDGLQTKAIVQKWIQFYKVSYNHLVYISSRLENWLNICTNCCVYYFSRRTGIF